MAQGAKPQLVATMELDRETKNTRRYAETDDSPAEGAIGTLYVNKFAASRVLDKPERITVTVEAG